MTDVEIAAQLLFEGTSRTSYFVSFRGVQVAQIEVVPDGTSTTVSYVFVKDLQTGLRAQASSLEEVPEMLIRLVRTHHLQ